MNFYPLFRTPHLNVQRKDGRINVLLGDGRCLLRESLVENDTSLDELTQFAQKEILFLAVRDLFNIVPLLKPFDEKMEYIQLQRNETRDIRRMSFLRGHILYLPVNLAAKIGAHYWFQAKRKFKNDEEIFCGNMDKMRVYSCDFICGELPAHLHDDVYANGRSGGGRGFNREDIFTFAVDHDIVISSMPVHPLERGATLVELAREVDKPSMKNNLPSPPSGIAANGNTYPIDVDSVRAMRERNGATVSDNSFDSIMLRLKLDAREKVYCIGTDVVNRFQMMRYIPWAITQGKTLRELCKGVSGTPSMLEIANWLQYYPDFRRELEAAEEIQAHVFMDMAQEFIMDLGDEESKDRISVARLKSNFMIKRAAIQSEKFREKKVIQTESLDNKNEAEVKRKLKMLLRGEVVSDIIDVTPISEQTDV